MLTQCLMEENDSVEEKLGQDKVWPTVYGGTMFLLPS